MEPNYVESAFAGAAPVRAPEPVITPAADAPVDRAERITAIDTLRGFALLGILMMNIIAMGMYVGAYDNPTVTGGATGANLWVWAILHVVAEGKMRCLFSLVFGASMILLTDRLEGRGHAADIYYRRLFWLLAFGIAHAYLLWLGEILYPYALCGLALFPFRKMAPKSLLIISGVLILLNSVAYIGYGFHQREVVTKGREAELATQKGQTLTTEQQEAKTEYEEWKKQNQPTAEFLEKDKKKWRGNFLSVVKARAEVVGHFHSMPYYHPMNWDIWSMMFAGMALLRLGVLSARRSAGFYGWMVLLGYGIGLPLNSYTAWFDIQHHFDPTLTAFARSTYDVGRLSVTLGHIGVIMLLCQKGWLRWLTARLGAVGQMAFSNYVMQSVITAILFTGYGFKLYGTMQRYQLYYVVAAIWIVQLIISPIWLQHYRFGPLEWGWRSLTYWKRQPMKLKSA